MKFLKEGIPHQQPCACMVLAAALQSGGKKDVIPLFHPTTMTLPNKLPTGCTEGERSLCFCKCELIY